MTLIIRMKIDDKCCVALKIKSIDHVSFNQKGGLVLGILYSIIPFLEYLVMDATPITLTIMMYLHLQAC